mmetsp:Transcript_64108/g.111805  ORF Transcript_64108/g.111805 Transcript_64108/m.111805 type:complete len:936 (-) Transcript_64108:122-2929(-)
MAGHMKPVTYGGAHSHGDLHSMEVIEDKSGARRKNGLPARYSKGRFLGKGGFAKCYEVQDMESKEIFAAKIVSKASITKPRAHAKLRSEISIHRSLDHEKVVKFYDYFEDSESVYIILEMCPNQTLNEFMRKRPSKRLSESESMFYLYDLIVALKYLHRRRVIHRDLKLGNLFLDGDVRIKVGDFGLAAQLEHDGEKKRTICGTPNYIAPEILEGRHGHSYEVDIWSLGVILYTMLIGRPPFETSDVKTTYRRIRYNQYSFPDTVRISDQAKDLIAAILRTDPRSRPSLDEILASPWFQNARLPPQMPVTINGYAASPRPAGSSARSDTPERGVADFARIDSPAPRFPLRDRSPSATPNSAAHTLPRSATVVPTKQATSPNCIGSTPGRYQPGSMGAACNTGRPPLASQRGNDENVAPNGYGDGYNAGAMSPTSTQGLVGTANGMQQMPCRMPSAASCGTTPTGRLHTPAPQQSYKTPSSPVAQQTSHSRQPPSRDSSPLAGAASNTVPTKVVAHGYSSARSATSSPRQPLHSSGRLGGLNIPPAASTPKESRSARVLGNTETAGHLITKGTPGVLRGTSSQPMSSRRPNTADSPRPIAHAAASLTPGAENFESRTPMLTPPQTAFDKKQLNSARKKERSSSSPALLNDCLNGPEWATPTAAAACPESAVRGFPSGRSVHNASSPAEACFGALLAGTTDDAAPSTGRQSSGEVVALPAQAPELWVTKWVDYSSKYGVGYILSDESIGVYFNDSTKIILCPEGDRFDYITRRTQDKPEIRTKHTFEDYPEDLKKKVTLLRHFRNYMLTDVLEKKDGATVGESSLPASLLSERRANPVPHEPGQAPYVKKWTRNRHAIMFQLSNKIVQVIFFDKTEAVLSSKSHMVTYVDKKNHACSYPLSSVQDVPSQELAKRLRYTKDILVNLLGARTGELGGAQ